MASKQPKKKPLGGLHGLLADARKGQAEVPQSELKAAKPDTEAVPPQRPPRDTR